MTNVPIIKFMFRSEWKALSDALKFIPVNESHDFDCANDVAKFLEGISAGLIVASIMDKNDLIQLTSLMKSLKQNNESAACNKVAVVNISGDRQLERAILNLGIHDLINYKVHSKSLRSEIDYLMESVRAQVKKKKSTAANTAKKIESKLASEKKITENTAVWIDPLNCEDDIWIVKKETDCKKILSRWLIKLTGPSSYIANWVETEKRGTWKFEFTQKDSMLKSDTGFWYFTGDQKPDFIWAENSWAFTGTFFELIFKSDSLQYSRMKLEGNQLFIAKTSKFAKQKEELIEESFDEKLVFKKAHEAKIETNSFEKEEEKLKNYVGKGKTEELNHRALSGKNITSHLNSAHLKMDLNLSEKSESEDPLSHKSSNKKLSSFWKGNNKYDKEEYEEGNLSTEVDEFSRGTELSLKGNSKHQSHYKNHNEPEKYKGKDPSDLNGAYSTDKLKSHLSSSNAEIKKESDDKAMMNKQDQETGDLLVFPEKTANKPFEDMSLGQVELDNATQDAKVSSFLSQGDLKVSCHLNDHFDEVIIFTATECALVSMKPVSLDLNLSYQEKQTNLKFSGEITQIDTDSEGMQYITVEISKDNATTFYSFMQLFETRQENINLFFKSAKGF